MHLSFASSFFLEHIAPQRLKKKLKTGRDKQYPLLPNGFRLEPLPQEVRDESEARQMFRQCAEPFVWRGGAAKTKLMDWNLKYLRNKAGRIPVKILALDGLSEAATKHTEKVYPLAQCISLLNEKGVYLRFSDLLENADELRRDLPIDFLGRLGDSPGRTNLQFFLGRKGTGTRLHAEMNCNIFIQVFGKKRWIFFPPSATPQLAPPAANRFYFFSPAEVSKSGRNFTKKTGITGWEIILNPGDILFCPPLVWHTVENMSLSCGVGFKFNRLMQAFRASPLLFCMNLLAKNPSYFTYLWYALIRKKHVILSSEA